MEKLIGSEKQVAWAEQIRVKFIDRVNEAIEISVMPEFAEKRHQENVAAVRKYLPELLEIAKTQTSAKWFIDNCQRGVNKLVELKFYELFDEMSEEEQNRVDKFWQPPHFEHW